MNSKHKIIIICSLLIFLLLLSAIYFCVPKIHIDILGNKYMTINVGEEYNELGAKAYYRNLFKYSELNVETNGFVDTEKIGKYSVIYEAKYNNVTKQNERIVDVVDTEKPILTLKDTVKLCKTSDIIDINVEAIDNYDGDISANVKYKIINNTVYLSVFDSSNNKAEIFDTIQYIDSEKPVITLNGAEEVSVNLGDDYIELGASAYDSCDGNISANVEISSNVNTKVIGTYEVKYKVKDGMNNEVSKVRKVIVEEKKKSSSNGSIIYLTFDDGPGAYTEELLNILDKYNVKATFFVTGQMGSKYQYLIGKEYEKGHTVGIHTYSHKWSVYDTIDDYLNDFEKIKKVIVEQTGVNPKYFRFPGGTSNRQAKVKMSYLADLMTEKGYTYFDWDIDCGDTHKNNTVDYIVKMVKSHLKDDNSYIILMHDIKKNTILALPTIIEYAQKNGYVFKAIDANTPLKQFKPYK